MHQPAHKGRLIHMYTSEAKYYDSNSATDLGLFVLASFMLSVFSCTWYT